MGKLQSKHGGSFASNALTCQRELERTASTRKDSSGTELREDSQTDHHCHLKVSLLPQRASDREPSSHLTGNKHLRKRSSHAGDSECNVLLEEDARQEWVFTLYDFDNSGKVTKEDMSSLMHSIYEVIEASVRQSCGGSTALRVKLVVTPSSSPEKTSQTAATRQQGTAQEVRSPERRTYCVDENTERRNHYLDLAGIENYSSKFDDEGVESPLFLSLLVHLNIKKQHHNVLGLICASLLYQNPPLKSQNKMHAQLCSTPQWRSKNTASPLSLGEASLCFDPMEPRLWQWGRIEMEERASYPGYMAIASTLPYAAILPSVSIRPTFPCSGRTARGCAPGDKMPLDQLVFRPNQGQRGRYYPACMSPVGSWLLQATGMITTTTMSTITIITITITTLHKLI
uniref:Protein naked cuticle homolog n=1 Tax=Myripristis murdjan TaxID=586833 RepID=A0A667WPI3_9TELE